jgi:hypothetical protein
MSSLSKVLLKGILHALHASSKKQRSHPDLDGFAFHTAVAA